jgi:hypothetical protein
LPARERPGDAEPDRRIEQIGAEAGNGAGGDPRFFDDIREIDGHGRGGFGGLENRVFSNRECRGLC